MTIPLCLTRHLTARLVHCRVKTTSLPNIQATATVRQKRFILNIQSLSFILTIVVYSYANCPYTRSPKLCCSSRCANKSFTVPLPLSCWTPETAQTLQYKWAKLLLVAHGTWCPASCRATCMRSKRQKPISSQTTTTAFLSS